MFGKKKTIPPIQKEKHSIWDKEWNDKRNAELDAKYAKDQESKDEYNKKYNPRQYEYDHMTKEERHQALLKKLDIDPYQTIRRLNQNFYETGDCGSIITKNYIIDAWLSLAQRVYFDDTVVPDKTLDKRVKEFNYLLGYDFKVKLHLAGSFGSWYKDNMYNDGEDSISLKSFNDGSPSIYYNEFHFKPIDKKDTEYLEYLNNYCEQRYHTNLNRFDATFSPSIAALFVADFITNGVDYNFMSFDINRDELKKILLLRARPSITRDEFLSQSQYGKLLLAKSAIRSGIGIYVYPSPIYANFEKLKNDIARMALLELKNTYGLDGYEISKDVTFEWMTDGFEQKMIGKLYPIYYFDEQGNAKRLPSYAIDNHWADAINNYKYGGKEFNPTKELVSIKEANADMCDMKATYSLRNVARESGLSASLDKKGRPTNKIGQFTSPADCLNDGMGQPFQSKEITFDANELCRKYRVALSISDYIDETELFADYINLNVMTKNFMSIPMEDLPEDAYLSQDESLYH